VNVGAPIPFSAARAYGIARPAPVRAAAPVTAPTPVTAPKPETPALETPERVQRLVAGRVPGMVDFDSARNGAQRADRFTLYTRAADRIEAATGIELGRALDIRG
jgi:hypothetical protein